ncbi:MAG: hypothetical protein WAT25_15310, partial [Paracoccaceae bacterium]
PKAEAVALPPLMTDPGEVKAPAAGLHVDPEDPTPVAPPMPALQADPGDAPAAGTALMPDPVEDDAGAPKPRRKGWWSKK